MPTLVGGRVAFFGVDQEPSSPRALAQPEVAVLVPCYNEATSVGTVIRSMRAALPDARIYVYDNNSTDGTAALAREAGAIVSFEPARGKGKVVCRMFADVEADIYVLVDGDDTYDATMAPVLIESLVANNLDMVTGARESTEQEAYRLGHRFGNAMLTGLVARLFGRRTKDLLSGYRVMSRRFVKSFPTLSQGFEIETELTIHANGLNMPIDEIATAYRARDAESESKLNTIRDGMRILWTIVMLLYSERPALFFGVLASVAAALGLLMALPIFVTFFETKLVPRFPTVVLVVGLMLVSLLCLCCGLILRTVTKGRQEMKRLAYLQIPSVRAALLH